MIFMFLRIKKKSTKPKNNFDDPNLIHNTVSWKLYNE